MTMTESQYNVFEFNNQLFQIIMVDSATQRRVDRLYLYLLGVERDDARAGRFKNFKHENQEHHVYLGLIGFADSCIALENAIDWIGAECHGAWSVHVSAAPLDLAGRHVLFSFDEAGDAMLFRLSIVKMGI